MKPSLIFFVVVLILGALGGYYYHEALNEKVQYERDSCYEYVKESRDNKFHNINNFSDVVIYGTEK